MGEPGLPVVIRSVNPPSPFGFLAAKLAPDSFTSVVALEDTIFMDLYLTTDLYTMVDFSGGY